jgi:SNF2 family DNA or RNA helicase
MFEQCPVRDYKPSNATLGPRRAIAINLFEKLHKVVQVKEAPAERSDPETPMVIFDPAAYTADDPRNKLFKVYIDGFIACKLRPHQQEGLVFMFECMSGIRNEAFTGCVLCDGMGLGEALPLETVRCLN